MTRVSSQNKRKSQPHNGTSLPALGNTKLGGKNGVDNRMAKGGYTNFQQGWQSWQSRNQWTCPKRGQRGAQHHEAPTPKSPIGVEGRFFVPGGVTGKPENGEEMKVGRKQKGYLGKWPREKFYGTGPDMSKRNGAIGGPNKQAFTKNVVGPRKRCRDGRQGDTGRPAQRGPKTGEGRIAAHGKKSTVRNLRGGADHDHH